MPATIGITSLRRGPTTTGTGGPTSSSRTTSAPRTSIAISALKDGKVRFEDVAASAGVLDHGAGMSATFLDYDNDGLLDIYTGNMWSAPGQRVTSAPAFMPDATPDVRALYRRHVRGNSLLRNLGNGRFEDKSIEAHAEMGALGLVVGRVRLRPRRLGRPLRRQRHALARERERADRRRSERSGPGRPRRASSGVRSSRTRRSRACPARAYDDAWRAINQLLIHGSIASRQRNVFLRNDGHGSFDDVSGALGLDLDQDGRSFALLDLDGDGDQDLVVMAARQAPQLRIFRNDFESSSRSLAVRLTGAKSNRDAIGARVTVQTDRMRRTKIVQAGSGFLSQHSKELLVGLGASERVASLTVDWPSGGKQVLTDVPLNGRVRIVEGGTVKTEPLRHAAGVAACARARQGTRRGTASPPAATWLYEPFPAPDFTLQGSVGSDALAVGIERKAGGRAALLRRGGCRLERRSRRFSVAPRRWRRRASDRSPSPSMVRGTRRRSVRCLRARCRSSRRLPRSA